MNESMLDTGVAGGSAVDMASGADYRIREAEARLDRRLAAIESQRARATWAARFAGAGLVVTLVALAIVLGTVVPNDGAWAVDSLSTEEILLRDVDGVERGRLATDSDGGTQLSLSDRDGRERIRLTVLADGSPGVTISDPDARPRAVLGYLPDGTATLVFADAQGISRAVFGLEADGSTQALFADRAGRIRTVVGVGADGVPSVSIVEEEPEGSSSPIP
jgi:hypothetical protein